MDFNKFVLGGTLTLGCVIGFLVGGWISQHVGKRIILIASNFGSFLIWLSLAFQMEGVEFIILARFTMGFCSAAAGVSVGRVKNRNTSDDS